MNEYDRATSAPRNGSVKRMTVIVVLEGRSSETATPVSKPHCNWRLSALPVAGMLVRALSSSVTLALLHGAQWVPCAGILGWLAA